MHIVHTGMPCKSWASHRGLLPGGAKGSDKLFSENVDAAFYSGKVASAEYFIRNVVSQASSKANLNMNGDTAALEFAENWF